jgi:hypothetical protein
MCEPAEGFAVFGRLSIAEGLLTRHIGRAVRFCDARRQKPTVASR